MEGRDIATVIMPDADIKLYFTATLQERSYRRYLEYKSSGKNLTLDEITKSILERDERDKNRKDAPLSIAKDALIIDSTGIDAQKLFHLVEKIIIEKSYRGI
jgi:cytidylate kinase